MHAASIQFLTIIGNTFDHEAVLELGSCDVNGAVRTYFPNASRYVGLDIEAGEGVDVIADAVTWRPEPAGTFDVVVSTSLFEHTPDWREIVETAAWHCKPDGIVAFTTVHAPFPPHAPRGGPLEDGDYYGDVLEADLEKAMLDAGFDDVQYETTTGGDILFVGACNRIPADWLERFREVNSQYQLLCEMTMKASHMPSDINEHLQTFYQLTHKLHAQKIIELGTRGANSTLAFLLAVEDTAGHVWSVDLEPAPTLPSKRWTFIQGSDLDLEVLAQLPDDADIVFIDTSHAYQQTLAELNVYLWKVRPGGRIVLHDTARRRFLGMNRQPPFPVARAVDEFCAEEDLSVEYRDNCSGLGIITIPEAK